MEIVVWTFERQGCGAVQPPLAPRADPRAGSMFWDPGDGFEAGWWLGRIPAGSGGQVGASR